MAWEERLAPRASSLFASLRDIGYSLETAVADIIDNSISALASEIDIFCLTINDEPYLAIVDNGTGMTAEELKDAMRPGSKSPDQERDPNDLGRFGLGLKTASLSQCRRLSVVTKQGGKICGAEWDLDVVAERDDWILKNLDDTDLGKLPHLDKLKSEGTIVLWRKLDRLVEGNLPAHELSEQINEKLTLLSRHLSLVFHKFLSGEIKGHKLSIRINGDPLEPADPFLIKNNATQRRPEERIQINGFDVTIQPCILPHISSLSTKQRKEICNEGNLLADQGCYIYRNGRLMHWGDWFGIIKKTEVTKLVRVQINFPNGLDALWTIDIKKSRVVLPPQVRKKIKKIIGELEIRSKRVHTGRVPKHNNKQIDFWVRQETRDCVRYEINMDHPLVVKLMMQIDQENIGTYKTLLDSLSRSLPVSNIYNDYSANLKALEMQPLKNREQIYSELSNLADDLNLESTKSDADLFSYIVSGLSQFSGNEDIVNEFIRERFN